MSPKEMGTQLTVAAQSERRGTSAANPKSGQLSAKLAAEKKKPLVATTNDDRPMVSPIGTVPGPRLTTTPPQDARNWN